MQSLNALLRLAQKLAQIGPLRVFAAVIETARNKALHLIYGFDPWHVTGNFYARPYKAKVIDLIAIVPHQSVVEIGVVDQLPPFLVTLAGMFLARGMAFVVSPQSLEIKHGFYDTIINSGIKDNVIPTDAVAIVNSRNMTEDPQDAVIAFMKKRIHDDRVVITPMTSNRDATEVTDVNGQAYGKVEKTVLKIMPGIIPAPFILMGGTDSRNFGVVSKNILRFAPQLDPKGYHGIDEHISVEDLARMIFFYSELIKDAGR